MECQASEVLRRQKAHMEQYGSCSFGKSEAEQRAGTLYLDSWFDFDQAIALAEAEEAHETE